MGREQPRKAVRREEEDEGEEGIVDGGRKGLCVCVCIYGNV